MNTLCRFCLNLSNTEMCKLEEKSDILHKIYTTLRVEISREDFLPKQICKECALKVEQIHEFCSKIKENEQKLLQYYHHGSLQNNFLKPLNNEHIKQEITESCNNGKPETHKEENTSSEYDVKENMKCNKDDNIKYEIVDDLNETVYSTDDETLSTKKKNKENYKQTGGTKLQNRHKRKKNTEVRIIDIARNEYSTSMVDIRPDLVRPTCLMCLKVCNTQIELIKHYNKEHFIEHKNSMKSKITEKQLDGNTMYECDICKISCCTKKEILKHVVVHNDERPLICKVCGRTYKTVTEIIRHARAHSGSKLHCSYKCGYTTAYRGALKEHEKRHLDVYKYRCEKCNKGFHVKTWYEQHQNIHNGVKPFVCQICGLAFHMARYLTAHKSLMHPQSSTVKRYICVHCNHKCDSANSLALHLEVHGINKEKEFLCDFCGKVLSSAEQLKYHHRMHSGVKPYSCSICNKSFAKKFNVKVHMSSHTGEKTHACASCGKRYSQRSTLLRHQKRNHAGSSPTRTG